MNFSIELYDTLSEWLINGTIRGSALALFAMLICQVFHKQLSPSTRYSILISSVIIFFIPITLVFELPMTQTIAPSD